MELALARCYAAGGHAGAPFGSCSRNSFGNLRVTVQTEIVIRCKIDDVLIADLAFGASLRVALEFLCHGVGNRHRSDKQGKYGGQQYVHFAETIKREMKGPSLFHYIGHAQFTDRLDRGHTPTP